MAKKKIQTKNKQNNIKFLGYLSALWFLLVLITKLVLDAPRCPDLYTQAQIDSSNCVVDANIGLGTIMLFVVVPITLLLVVLWGVALFGKKK